MRKEVQQQMQGNLEDPSLLGLAAFKGEPSSLGSVNQTFQGDGSRASGPHGPFAFEPRKMDVLPS